MRYLRSTMVALIVTLLGFAGPVQMAHAGVVGTADLLPQQANTEMLFTRSDLRDQLIELGVAPEQAAQRVAMLSDQQLAEISTRLEDLPAGADVGGLLFALFIVFVITDVIGATDIFPFIEPVK